MDDGFLTRWSRRKLDGREVPDAPPPDADAEPVVDAAELPAEEGAVTPEEIAALPAAADITLDTDITAFLRKGVPALLRNAALQRLWVLDPDIRNFVGDARDYAWDWNVPGGVPVSGPLETGTDIPAMLRRVFGEDSETARENVIVQSMPAETPPAPAPRAPVNFAAEEQVAPMPDEFSDETEDEQTVEESAPVRRHGSALPA
jgi:hypothetical protein